MTSGILAVFALAQLVVSGPEGQLAEAARTYSLESARAVVSALEPPPGARPDPVQQLLRARALLLMAELQRIDFEHLPETETARRRTLGREIDTAAEAGLEALEGIATTSETLRVKADLLGTMIRSQYRAGKYKQDMNSAIGEALRLDPDNARAYVSAAKTHLFKPSASEEDLRRGLDLLEDALARDPALEPALLLKAHALELLGQPEAARPIWEQCLRDNPDCAPAKRALNSE